MIPGFLDELEQEVQRLADDLQDEVQNGWTSRSMPQRLRDIARKIAVQAELDRAA